MPLTYRVLIKPKGSPLCLVFLMINKLMETIYTIKMLRIVVGQERAMLRLMTSNFKITISDIQARSKASHTIIKLFSKEMQIQEGRGTLLQTSAMWSHELLTNLMVSNKTRKYLKRAKSRNYEVQTREHKRTMAINNKMSKDWEAQRKRIWWIKLAHREKIRTENSMLTKRKLKILICNTQKTLRYKENLKGQANPSKLAIKSKNITRGRSKIRIGSRILMKRMINMKE